MSRAPQTNAYCIFNQLQEWNMTSQKPQQAKPKHLHQKKKV